MQLFNILNQDFFRPLTGINRQRYADLISLIWERCRQNALYSVEKSTMLDEAEAYFSGVSQSGTEVMYHDDDEEIDETSVTATTPRYWASYYMRKSRDTGWLEEKEGDYDEESKYAVNYRIIPIIQAFNDVISPKIITYQGKLYKIYTALSDIKDQCNPFETVLEEVAEDIESLNASLRQLASSIETHMDQLTQGKTPVEVLELFNAYEEEIVVGAYHRFKTSENLFYYRSELFEKIDSCEDEYRKVKMS